METTAAEIHQEDIELNKKLGDNGADFLKQGGVLTICNTGALATGELLNCNICTYLSLFKWSS